MRACVRACVCVCVCNGIIVVIETPGFIIEFEHIPEDVFICNLAIYGLQPSGSGDLDHFYKLSFFLPKEDPHFGFKRRMRLKLLF